MIFHFSGLSSVGEERPATKNGYHGLKRGVLKLGHLWTRPCWFKSEFWDPYVVPFRRVIKGRHVCWTERKRIVSPQQGVINLLCRQIHDFLLFLIERRRWRKAHNKEQLSSTPARSTRTLSSSDPIMSIQKWILRSVCCPFQEGCKRETYLLGGMEENHVSPTRGQAN